MPPARHLVLLGLMGSGKTTIGRRVAERLGRPLVDGDDVLEQRTGGRTAAQVTASDGIDALHAMEADVALTMLGSPVPSVVAPAASVVEVSEVRAALAGHLIVWLTASPEDLARRAAGTTHRPLLDDGDPVALFRRQLAAREPLVRPFADLVIDGSTTTIDDAADAVAALAEGTGLSQPGAAPSSSPPPS